MRDEVEVEEDRADGGEEGQVAVEVVEGVGGEVEVGEGGE